MANYLTPALLKSRVGGAALYVELTDDDVPPDGVTDAGVEQWILDTVDDIANGCAARGGYTVPLVAIDSALLIPFLLDIANYKLKARRGTPSKADEKLYDDAMLLLGAIATGDFILPSSAAGQTGAFTHFGFDSEGQMFSRTILRNL